MKRNCALACCVLWLSTATTLTFAQNSAASAQTKTKYDAASEIKFTGVVDDIEQRSMGAACKARYTYVIVKAEDQSYTLQVGPKWFVDDLTANFAKADKLQVTGWKITKEGNPEVVVHLIKRGDWSLEPRSDRGAPNWLWMPAAKDSGKCN